MKKGFFYLIYLLTVIVLIFGVAELFLRYQGWFYTYTEKRSGFFVEPYEVQEFNWLFVHPIEAEIPDESPDFKYTIKTNKEGLRDIDHKIQKDSNEIRIVCLGDSYTQGIGAPVDSMWPSLLQGKLSKVKSHNSHTVFKGGVASSDPFYEAMLFKLNYLKYDPDILILAINDSDLDDVMIRGGDSRFLADSTIQYNPKPPISELFYDSHLIRFYYIGIRGYSWLYLTKQEQADERRKAAKKIIEKVRDLYLFCEEQGIAFIPILHPTFGELYSGEYDEDLKFISDELTSSNIHYCDILNHLKDQVEITGESSKNYYWPVDGHNNPLGYAHFANGVFNCLKKEIKE